MAFKFAMIALLFSPTFAEECAGTESCTSDLESGFGSSSGTWSQTRKSLSLVQLGFKWIRQKGRRVAPSADLAAGSTSEEPKRLIEVSPREGATKMKDSVGKTIVIYAWFETEKQLPNLLYFIKHAVLTEDSSLVDFLFVDTTPSGSKHFPANQSNVRVIHRENIGFDMRSWMVGLGTINKEDYVNFVLMNGCVRGPFLGQFPSATAFASPFADFLHGNVHLNNVHLVGTTINCMCATQRYCAEDLHLQSMFLMSDRIGIDVINSTLQANKLVTKGDAVDSEMRISIDMRRAGYGIAALQKYWRGHDFQNRQHTIKRCKQFRDITAGNFGGDPYFPMNDIDPVSLSLKHVDPEDVVMFKTNRQVSEERLAALTAEE